MIISFFPLLAINHLLDAVTEVATLKAVGEVNRLAMVSHKKLNLSSGRQPFSARFVGQVRFASALTQADS